MDLRFIKKEEPVEYDLIITNQSQADKIESYDYGSENLTESYTITVKEEHESHTECKLFVEPWEIVGETNDGNNSNDSMNISEYVDCGNNISENEESDESSTDGKKKPTKKRKSRKYIRTKNRRKNVTDDQKVKCDECKRVVQKKDIEFHLLTHDGPPFDCRICGKTFSRRDSFRHHRKVHLEKKFECDYCNKSFRTKTLLLSHFDTHIKREKTFQCKLCQAKFFRKNTMQRHLRNLHSTLPRVPKFKCTNPLCQQQFKDMYYLKQHNCWERVPKVKCSYCKMKFFNKSARSIHHLQWHIRKCDKCGKRFKNMHKLALHVAQNCTDRITYDCDLCSVQIVGKMNLLKHFATYHQTFDCDYCGRLFQTQGIRNFHQHRCSYRLEFIEHDSNNGNTKTSLDRFECDVCGWKFMQKYGIVEHMRMMHSMKSFSGTYFAEKFTCFTNRATLSLYPCCNEQFDGNKLNPMHVITKKCKFYCRRCKSVYSNFYSMYRHSAEHTTRVHQSIRHMEKCNRCDRQFKWKLSVPEYLKRATDDLC